ncbi:MAG: BatD family protein [Verrucomicrobia bacterium]|nr:BatD family protein [Verrucomicrobiota bacterium]
MPDPLSAYMVAQPPVDTTSPLAPSVEFEPPVITNGQSTVYRVVLNALRQAVEWPESIPLPDGCTVREGASGELLQTVGGAVIPHTSFLYHLTPSSTGTFTLPAYSIRARGETVQIPAATFTVVPTGSTPVEPAPRIQLTAKAGEFFVGQPVELQVAFPGRPDGTVETLSQVNVVGDALIVDRDFRTQRVETRVQDGVSRPVFLYDALVTPMRAGPLTVTAQGYAFGNRVQGLIVITGQATLPGGAPAYKLVDSEPLTLNILPLPRPSELPGFTGAIGSFSVDPPTLSTNRVLAGDLITLIVTVRGQGNLERVLPPKLEPQPQWQVFPPRKENLLPAILRQRGFVQFEYKLIPLDPTVTATPPIPFCAFDPSTRQYVDLTIEPLPITVEPSAFSTPPVPGEVSVIEARSFLRELLQKPGPPTALAGTLESPGRTARTLRPLHQQPWFAAIQLIPALLLGGLWSWDRRRRFFELHPEALLRLRARRAIRHHARHARKAARQADARDFLHHAIQGFREACAPSAPADPRALVCDDVLRALPADPAVAQTRDVVKNLFTAANEWRFGDVPPDPEALLDLSQQVDQQLEVLRDKL